MKTSIKILLGLLLVLFLIPTILIMAVNYQVETKGIKPYNETSNWSRVDLGPSRFIKIAAPEEALLECKLTLSDKPHYMIWAYGQGGDDSVSIRQEVDTLFVTYIESRGKDNVQYHRSLELFVSEWQQLQVIGATVKIDSSFGSADKTIVLGSATLELGTALDNDENFEEEGPVQMQVPGNTSASFNNLSLKATNSKLIVNSGFNINKLQLAFQAGSLKIKTGAQLANVSGTVSPATKLQVNGAFITNLTALAK